MEEEGKEEVGGKEKGRGKKKKFQQWVVQTFFVVDFNGKKRRDERDLYPQEKIITETIIIDGGEWSRALLVRPAPYGTRWFLPHRPALRQTSWYTYIIYNI